MSDFYVRTEQLRKTYHISDVFVHALAGLDLEIERNSFTLVMGPSGSGKSTLLYLLGGLDRPTSGNIVVDGKAIDKLDENALARYRKQTVGFIFQSFNLIPSMNAWENIAFPMRFNRITGRKRKARALELLARVGMEDRAYHKPTELSGGQQQRVAIARSMVNNPQIILADEPTGNLDTTSGNVVMEVLADLHRSGVTVIVVSHDSRNIPFATQVVNILDGKIDSNHQTAQAVAQLAPVKPPEPAAPDQVERNQNDEMLEE